MLSSIPSKFQTQIDNALSWLAPFTKRVYLVGGSVRDLMIGEDLHDLDVEVYDIEPLAFDALMQKMGAVGVGKSFFVYKLGNIDFSLPRVEKKIGLGHKGFDVSLCQDEKLASSRRDFTMNAMMLDLISGKLLDFWGGKQDIAHKTIALIDEKSFIEDSLRVLRAVQFSARLGFKIEDKTLEVMQNISLEDLSKPRILWEFEKLFYASFLHFGLFYMYKLCLFEKCFTCKEKAPFLAVALELARYKRNFEEALLPYYFFYIVANKNHANPLAWLKKLEAPNHYLSTFKNQPFFEGEVSDEILLQVSLDVPIKLWLGNYKKGIKERAKAFGVYEDIYTGGVNVHDVIKDGFEKEAIRIELKRRRMEMIKQWK